MNRKKEFRAFRASGFGLLLTISLAGIAVPASADNPSVGFDTKQRGRVLHGGSHPQGLRPRDNPANLGSGGNLIHLTQHGNINGGVDTGDLQFGMVFGARVWSGNFGDAIEFAYYVPSDPNLRYRNGDQRLLTGRIGDSTGGVDRGWYYCPEGYVGVGL